MQTQPPPENSSPLPIREKPKGWLYLSFLLLISAALIIIFTKSYRDNREVGIIFPISESSHSQIMETTYLLDHTDFSSAETNPDFTYIEQTETTAASKIEESGTPVISSQLREKARIQLSEDIKKLLDEELGRYGVYYLNLENGESIELFAEEPFVAASSIKLAYNTCLYQEALAGQFSLNEKMAYNAKKYPGGDYEDGTGEIQYKANGTKFTLSEISHLSIYISDNCAANMILRKLGGIESVNENYLLPISNIVSYRDTVRYKNYKGQSLSGKNRTSAMDLALYAKNLYDLYQENKEGYLPLINELSKSTYEWGISDIETNYGDPVLICHKVGFNWKYFTNNDAGIIFGAEDYVLAVMTENNHAANAQLMIGQVSQMIYDYIQIYAG